ncbi:Rossmann-fold NAD(P)-binding domain-containing protein [Microvirga lotononidis]|uniref:Putative ornithine cyclodeaminase, mu-crystallin n=1 Tax=Microvirga lotononidis TaxID=864069 RepID=I4YVY8_9HYPH|nr:putative ornithine cyclodeaminase, mu-crystallin [Microvirga lotononidis]EIM28130.1 putative ornithine cyclodeaminase, mu-crystallin [Microvirga lotononidis]WQO27765.1 ornithine cyclodeaminase family protein [Microvirga lotononidis]
MVTASSITFLDLAQIEERLKGLDLVGLMEGAFAAFSRGEAVVPAPGELLLEEPPGEVHIKYGYLTSGDTYVIKIASGFWNNPARGLSSSDGLLLVFRKDTGELAAVLNDRGRLTDLRTAAAGAVAAKHLAPETVEPIGVLGCGIQAELQVQLLQSVRPCRNIVVWGRNPERASAYARRMQEKDFSVEVASSPAEVASRCRLIVTATASPSPLLVWRDLQPGTHITAIGADSADKQELDASIIHNADIVVTDSRVQAQSRGELGHAYGGDPSAMNTVAEIGEIVMGKARGRETADQITVSAFSGLAVQDIAIASAVLKHS